MGNTKYRSQVGVREQTWEDWEVSVLRDMGLVTTIGGRFPDLLHTRRVGNAPYMGGAVS